MTGAPWWVSLAIGLLTAAVTVAGVVVSSGRQLRGLRERIDADGGAARASLRGVDRSEWFRRVQWAHGLLQRDETQIPGFGVLRVLADQADDADAELISALVKSSSAVAGTAEPVPEQKVTVQAASSQCVDTALSAPDTGGKATEGRHDD